MRIPPRLAALAVIVAACGSPPKPPAPAGQVAVANAAPPPAGPVVTLVVAGSEPRRTLRYAPTKGARGHADMIMDMAMTIGVGASPGTRVVIPPVTMALDTVITSATAGGFEITAAVTDVVVAEGDDPAVAAAMRAEVSKMAGMTMITRMSPRGVVEHADVTMPAGVSSQMHQMVESMKQSMGQISPPFPELPVGPGAQWTVVSAIDTGTMQLEQTAAFDLVSLDGDHGTAKIQIQQSAPAQVVRVPGTPAEVTTRLESLTGSGSGEMTFDLARVMPRKAMVLSTAAIAMTVTSPQQRTPLDMAMTMEIAMGVRSAAGQRPTAVTD